MTEVTPEQVRDAMVAANITRVPVRDCSLCGYEMAYYRLDNNELFFDLGCDCTGSSKMNPRDYSALSDWINMQIGPEHRQQVAAKFGITQPLKDSP